MPCAAEAGSGVCGGIRWGSLDDGVCHLLHLLPLLSVLPLAMLTGWLCFYCIRSRLNLQGTAGLLLAVPAGGLRFCCRRPRWQGIAGLLPRCCSWRRLVRAVCGLARRLRKAGVQQLPIERPCRQLSSGRTSHLRGKQQVRCCSISVAVG